jgi:hypothetical protein
MSFTVFLTLCVVGCDVLIYFLYEWAFGERRRTRMRKAASRQRAEALANPEPRPTNTAQKSLAARSVFVMGAKQRTSTALPRIPMRYNEELAYRRVAASFAQLKPRT